MNQTRIVIGRLIPVVAAAVLLFGGALVGQGRAQAPTRSFELMEATIPELQAALAAGTVTSRELVTRYLARIDAYDQKGPALNAISAINDRALAEADALDAERKTRAPPRTAARDPGDHQGQLRDRDHADGRRLTRAGGMGRGNRRRPREEAP